jgi:HD-like signal output (HDOD) protein
MSDIALKRATDPSITAKSGELQFLQDIAADLSRGEVTFPTFDAATLKIRNALNDPDISLERLANALQQEPLVCLRLIKMANAVGARGGFGCVIADLRVAVSRLGLNVVHSVAMSAVLDQLRVMKEARPLDPLADVIYRHSIHVAARARVLARYATSLNPDEALFAGLVHDVGYYYLLSRLPRYPGLASEPASLRRIIAEWHAPIGTTVLHGFNLPDSILEAVSSHEDPGYRLPLETYADVLRAASHYSRDTSPAEIVPALANTEVAPELVELLLAHEAEMQAVVASLQ